MPVVVNSVLKPRQKPRLSEMQSKPLRQLQKLVSKRSKLPMIEPKPNDEPKKSEKPELKTRHDEPMKQKLRLGWLEKIVEKSLLAFLTMVLIATLLRNLLRHLYGMRSSKSKTG
jgi:hypothetical protein